MCHSIYVDYHQESHTFDLKTFSPCLGVKGMRFFKQSPNKIGFLTICKTKRAKCSHTESCMYCMLCRAIPDTVHFVWLLDDIGAGEWFSPATSDKTLI